MGDARVPHAVAVGKIQPEATFIIEHENPETNPVIVKGFARHLFTTNTQQASRIVECAARLQGVSAYPLAEGAFLLLAPSEAKVVALCEYLRSQYVTEPRNPNAPREKCEQVPLVRAVEFVLSGAVVRPIAVGAGGPTGKRYHALYPRTEPTKQEQTLQLLPGDEGASVAEGSSMHTAITGRGYSGLPKRGYGN